MAFQVAGDARRQRGRPGTRKGGFIPQGEWALSIHDNNGGLDSSVFHMDPHIVTVYTKLHIQFNYTAWSMDNNEDFFLEYSSSNGDVGTWDPAKQYVAGTDFPCCINDNPGNIAYNDTVKLDSADFLFTRGAKIASVDSVAVLRAMVTSYVYIDQLSFEGFRPNP